MLDYLGFFLRKEIDKATRPMLYLFKKLLVGLGLLSIAYALFVVGSLLLILAIFFSLAYIPVLVLPAIFSGVIAIAISVIFLFLALVLMKRKV